MTTEKSTCVHARKYKIITPNASSPPFTQTTGRKQRTYHGIAVEGSDVVDGSELRGALGDGDRVGQVAEHRAVVVADHVDADSGELGALGTRTAQVVGSYCQLQHEEIPIRCLVVGFVVSHHSNIQSGLMD